MDAESWNLSEFFWALQQEQVAQQGPRLHHWFSARSSLLRWSRHRRKELSLFPCETFKMSPSVVSITVWFLVVRTLLVAFISFYCNATIHDPQAHPKMEPSSNLQASNSPASHLKRPRNFQPCLEFSYQIWGIQATSRSSDAHLSLLPMRTCHRLVAWPKIHIQRLGSPNRQAFDSG